MATINLTIAKTHLNAWLEAELACTTNQSYTIGSRTLTRADLAEIRETIKYWQGMVTKLENQARHGSRNGVYRYVPRDL